MSSPSKQPAASPSILDRITADERGRGETDLQKEVRELKIKVKSLTDAYARQQASTRELDAELSQARALIGDNTDHFEQGRRTVTEHRLRAEDQDKTIQELRDELLRMREAHERAVEKVSTLTNTTLDQTAEIYRLNELVVQLGQHHLDKPGATPMQVQQELHKSSFWVPVV